MLEDGCSDAFLVVKDNTILCEQYFNGMAADSFHLLNSVTKSFVGMLTGIQIAQGLITHQLRLLLLPQKPPMTISAINTP
ncbi:MAG: hypothetical protein ACJA2O_003895 [Candidatus Azotimanducaceae bacterium]|jgi:hypothetical protein